MRLTLYICWSERYVPSGRTCGGAGGEGAEEWERPGERESGRPAGVPRAGRGVPSGGAGVRRGAENTFAEYNARMATKSLSAKRQDDKEVEREKRRKYEQRRAYRTKAKKGRKQRKY